MDQDKLNEIKKFLSYNSLKNERFVLISRFCIALLIAFFFAVYLTAPKDFPIGSIYNLRAGQTYSKVATDLSNKQIIESQFWFKTLIFVFSYGERKIIAGDYSLYERQNVLVLAWRISHGDFQTKPLKITIPEGLNSSQIADIYYKNLPFFDRDKFLAIVQSQNLEGYLFPDTYFLEPSNDEYLIIKLMTDNFNEKISTLEGDIKKFGKSESDVIKMASILEEEARLYESRQIVAGILWKRLSLGMALQVDSAFKYINGKTTKDLTLDDLKISSPYNTYTHRGLTPTPISNPGLDAIKAAINPTKTPYFYFLTGDDGNMYYAVTLEEHAANKDKYLK
jgi:UPF0755 protein